MNALSQKTGASASGYYHPMGLNFVTTRVTEVTGRGPEYSAEFLVDTGAVESLVDGAELRKIGVEPSGKKTCELADGSTRELEYGFVRMNVLGDETVTQIIFGDPGVAPLIGVLVLESIGIVVDPRSQTLKRLHAMPLK